MSRISDAVVLTLLEEITDYEKVLDTLTKKQFNELLGICDEYEDRESIETIINSCLMLWGYDYDTTEYLWHKPQQIE